MKKGRIIFLNGTSSSGKTSIAKELQNTIDEPFMHISIDNFILFYPEYYFSPEKKEYIKEIIIKSVSGMHRCIPALASAGNNLIVDHVLEREEWLVECVELLTDYSVLFVGVKCPLEELEHREKGRDRQPGMARYQFDKVHKHGTYDVEVDTSVLDVEECASAIVKAHNANQTPFAFSEIRRKLSRKK